MINLPDFLLHNLDYLCFVGFVVALGIVLNRWAWRKIQLATFGWIVFAMVLVAGWFLTNRAGKNEQIRLQQMVEGYAPTYARELERMGHASITSETDPADPAYLQMIEAEKRWLQANSTVSDIYTMRRQPDGKLILIVDSETDYDHNGKYEGEREERTAIGEVYEETFLALDKMFTTGQATFDEDFKPDRWGTNVTAIEPMRDGNGKIEAALCVDFSADTWVTAIQRARLTTISYCAFLLLLAGAGSGMATHIIALRDIVAEKRQQEILLMEKKKLETLVNSIDGIVWECDARSFQFTFISQQIERILGYTSKEWLADPNFWCLKLAPEDQWAKDYSIKMVARKRPYTFDYRMIAADGRQVWIRETAGILLDKQGEGQLVQGIFLDITDQKRAAEELLETHRAFVESSRYAGMAEVATGVLHNVGNVLNSVNVSGNVIGERIAQSKVGELRKVADLLEAHRADFADFLLNDPRGKWIPELIARVSDAISKEQITLANEVKEISVNINHIKEIVAMQQSYAKLGGVLEPLDVMELLEDALRINAASLDRHDIEVRRQFQVVPRVLVDRHKVLQILVNLISNAKQAMDAVPENIKILTLIVEQREPDLVNILVRDNGEGIAADNLQRIFSHGFTTKKKGHGFGLHSSALAADEMGGTLLVESTGPGHGATFILTLPHAPPSTALPNQPNAEP